LNFGPNFTIRVPAEFINVFNRAKIGYPIPSNPQGAPIQDEATDWCDFGFGVIKG
jgi:hypothetical protein